MRRWLMAVSVSSLSSIPMFEAMRKIGSTTATVGIMRWLRMKNAILSLAFIGKRASA